MLINNVEKLELLTRARDEMRDLGSRTPSREFYEMKLGRAWERAEATRAYRGLGSYSWDALQALPLTTKSSLREDPWGYVSAELDAMAKYYETTGTSGRGTPTPRLGEDVIWNVASVAEAWGKVLGPGDRVAILLPSDVVPVGDLASGVCELLGVPHARCYPFATGICDWDRLAEMWETLRPTVVFLAPGVALQLTRLLKQREILESLSSSVRGLMLLGEVSTRALRDRLSQTWRAAVFDASYGSTETGTLAACCPRGEMHLLPAANLFELATESAIGPLAKGSCGRLVVTPLNLYARPLLRFDTGDEVVVGSDCDCGSESPRIVIQGRAADTIEVRGARLTIEGVERIVYGSTSATGYLVEIEENLAGARLLLERDVEHDRAGEEKAVELVQRSSMNTLGLHWDGVVFVNSLPAMTKSGGSQKSWKRSNVRVVRGAQ